MTTGVGAVLNTAKVEPGSSCSGYWHWRCRFKCYSRCCAGTSEKIIAVDIAQKKLDFAKRFGATDVVNATDDDPVEAVHELTDGRGVDYAFEVIGNRKLSFKHIVWCALLALR